MKKSVRCHIIGDVLPVGYFEQDMAWADGGNGYIYLRIGCDVYEGQIKKNSMKGTVIHLAVESDAAEEGAGATSENGKLTNIAVSDEDYVFWPMGKMEQPSVASDLDVEMDGSFSALPDISLDLDELHKVSGLLGDLTNK